MQSSERVLVFTDVIVESETVSGGDLGRRKRLREIALLVAETGKAFAGEIIFHEFPATCVHGAEPPESLWKTAFGKIAVKALKDAKLLKPLLNKKANDEMIIKAGGIVASNKDGAVNAVIALSNYSTSHTAFRKLLTESCGTRYASMPLFDSSMLDGAMAVDWKALEKRTKAITALVNKAQRVEVKTSNGSKMVFSKKSRKAHSDTGILKKPGSFGNLPAGESYFAPLEGSSNGTMVLEFSPTRRLASPVIVTVKDGIATEVLGDEPYADSLRTKFSERTENRNIAELGIGTNDRATRADNILESEKILGTIHIAFGDNSGFGGHVKTPFHQDFVFFKPTITLIGKAGEKTIIMRSGKLAS